MFQSEMNDLLSGVSPELLLLGHEEEIDQQVSEILLQDFNERQAGNHGLNFGEDLQDEALGTDLCYLSAKPSDITGQSLAVTMEDDKNKVLSSMAKQASSIELVQNKPSTIPIQNDYQQWMESTAIEIEQAPMEMEPAQKEANAVEETQAVIEEIQDFLDQFMDEGVEKDQEGNDLVEQLLSSQQQKTLQLMDVEECPLANSTMIDEETKAAEDLLDKLIQGNFTVEEIQQLEQQAVPVALPSQNDSGYRSFTPSFNVDNVSEVVTEDGRNIIIVIAPAPKNQENGTERTSFFGVNIPPLTPGTIADINESDCSEDESNESSGDDCVWMPENEDRKQKCLFKVPTEQAKNKRGRKLQERKSSLQPTKSNGRVSKLRNIKDRKERKKLQNVEAARRYRDKKKEEESAADFEEKALMEKNAELKSTLNGIEGELGTLKKLMKELGLIKLVTPSSARVR